MSFRTFRDRLKPWMLPIAMLGGLLLHDFINAIAFLAPYLIFVMLLVTFCKVRPSEFRVTGLSWGLLAVQILGGVAVYLALLPLGPELAQGVFICVFCPTATAAPVVTGMLGGSISRVATYSIVSNLTVAALAPPLFSWMGASGADYLVMLRGVCSAVAPLLIAPLACAIVLGKVAPKVHRAMATHQGLSFYIWAVSLFIVVGRAVSYMLAHHERIGLMVALAIGAGVVCVIQFWVGRKIGTRFGDKIAGAQGLGQKNTVLAIWMALTYLAPVSSVAPAAYVAWQNTINSVQLYMHQRRSLSHSKQECVGSKQK